MVRSLRPVLAVASVLVALPAVTPAAAQSAAPLHIQVFNAADVNSDGVVSRPEYNDAVSYVFVQLDTDNNGTLSRFEFGRPGGLVTRRFNIIDVTNDGVITLSEMQAFQAGRFGAIDANGDQLITRAEADTYVNGTN